ncbi:enoyl-CoA hydratase/isomerase family protein [Salmonella enterica subsp. enterica serovar Java]|nr:enoyl-CoA hydratase/isomerase family protein [Salmonella enterica subsp. enterica serovar Java]
MDFGGDDEVRFEKVGLAGVITLNRPQALNALTHKMVKAIARALTAWETDAGIAAVMIRGEGRAFCSGGDLMAIYNNRANPPLDFFADEYRLNYQIERYRKPYVALIDGIVMGGGVGVSFHGSHRVVTENTLFAMPEVGVGFFPDVGGSHLLPDLGDNYGLYLGLTGARIRWGDALFSGLATHAVKAENLGSLFSQIAMSGEVEATLRNYFFMARRETERERLAAIDRWFGAPDIHAVVAALEAEAPKDEFAAATLATMRQKSPTSLAVAFRQISAGQTMSMAECMKMEFRIVNRMLAAPDSYEGIRTVLVDRGEKPAWDPPTLEQVKSADIDAYFAPLPGGELKL